MNGAPQEGKPPWWTYAGGWEREGIHTPMRRCGYCKCDLSEFERERGACRRCATAADDKLRREQLAAERAQREDLENAPLRTQPHAAGLIDESPAPPEDDVDDGYEDELDRQFAATRDALR